MSNIPMLVRISFTAKNGTLNHWEYAHGTHSQIAEYTNNENASYGTVSEWVAVVDLSTLETVKYTEIRFLTQALNRCTPDERTRITFSKRDGGAFSVMVPDLEHSSYLTTTCKVSKYTEFRPRTKKDAQDLIDFYSTIFESLPDGE